MSSDSIRVAWNVVSQRLCAVHPDDGTYVYTEISFGDDRYAEATTDIQDRASAPGGRRLVIGPTLAEIKAAFEDRPERTVTPEELADERARAARAPVPSWANPPTIVEQASSEGDEQ